MRVAEGSLPAWRVCLFVCLVALAEGVEWLRWRERGDVIDRMLGGAEMGWWERKEGGRKREKEMDLVVLHVTVVFGLVVAIRMPD